MCIQQEETDSMDNIIMNANVLTYAALYAAFRVGDLCCVLLVPNIAIKDGKIK